MGWNGKNTGKIICTAQEERERHVKITYCLILISTIDEAIRFKLTQ